MNNDDRPDVGTPVSESDETFKEGSTNIFNQYVVGFSLEETRRDSALAHAIRYGQTAHLTDPFLDGARVLKFASKAEAYLRDGVEIEHLTHNEDTMTKVYLALRDVGLSEEKAIEAVSNMQNEGVLFRERDR